MAVTLWAVLGCWAGAAMAGQPITVFAAASLKNALDEVADLYTQDTGTGVSLSYGGSSALARQIQYGAPAHLFLSANAAWTDILATQGLLKPGTRVDLLSNRLVLIAAPDVATTLVIGPGMDLSGALGEDKLAMALVDAVPAGIYGRAALQSLGVWDSVQGQIAQTDNVRAALRLVSVGEAPLGIVYATDAAADPTVRIVGMFPENTHPQILYPMALLAEGNTGDARAFAAFLSGPQARAIFDRHGFSTPETRPKGTP
ncbi:MAG: molybdate transport system substrate-binding protein [Paracoccaceae bacterium]|jgi:molybdate transport system substrate-binding protein